LNRHERRKRASEERRTTKGAAGASSAPATRGVTSSDPLAVEIASKLEDRKGESEVISAAVAAAGAMDGTLAAIWPASALKPACKRGCSYCCTVRVSVTIPEVIRVAVHARHTLGAEQLAGVMKRARDNARRTHGTTNLGYPPRLACAFLGEDQSCLVHAARPLVCRREHSLDVAQCKRGYELQEIGTDHPISRVAPAIAASNGVLNAFREGLADAAVDSSAYELQEAAHIALSDPRAITGWLAGQPTFARARLNPALDPAPTQAPDGRRRLLPGP